MGLLADTTADDSSVAIRHAVCGLRLCLRSLLHSPYSPLATNLLRSTLRLRDSTYWLVKVGTQPTSSCTDGAFQLRCS